MSFRQIEERGQAWFDEAVATGMQETLTLDFKGVRVGKVGAQFTADSILNRDGRTTLSRALSAFSNSAGGQIVFGVDCRRNDEGIDCASALDPIPNVAAALSSISAAIGDLMQPKSDAVRAIAVPSVAGAPSGYVVVDIPRSERRPHMCQMTKQYHKRAGTSSFVMEHYDVEDAFRRQSTPDIELFIMFTGGMSVRGPDSRLTIHMPLMIKNVGLISAKYVAVTLQPDNRGVQMVVDVNNRGRGNRYSQYAGRTTIAAPLDFVAHPGEVREFDLLQFDLSVRGAEGIVRAGDMPIREAFAFQMLTLSAENMSAREFPVELNPADFAKLVEEFDFR